MPSIEHAAIFADEPGILKAFYEDAFGFRVIVDNSKSRPPGYFLAGEQGAALEIIGRPFGADNVNQRHVCHVAFLVADFDSARALLERRGVVFETDTVVENESMRTAFFNDPEGNRIQIVWRAKPLGS